MLPRLPATEAQTSVVLPFLAQVTAVSGNTLTLSTSLPQAYPAGAWVAKVNRPILISFNNNSNTIIHLPTQRQETTLMLQGLGGFGFRSLALHLIIS
jgi:hypothetical protein